MKKLFVLFIVAPAVLLAEARVINVADHGIVPGADATYALNKLVESIEGEEGVTLSFPKGEYAFHAENALEMYRAVANHDNGLKRMVFPLFNLKDVTIDGNGSLFMMHGRVVPFTIESVDGVTLKNFTIDWAQAFHAEMQCIEQNTEKNYAVFRIDEKRYPHTVKNGELLFDRMGQEDPIGSNILWDPDTRAPIYDTNRYTVQGWKPSIASRPGPGLVKLEGCFRKDPPPVGSVLVAYGVHPTSRLCPAIHVTNSKDLRIENIIIHAAGGMGLIVERTENCSLESMKVTSTAERVISTRADATHFIGCKGTIQVENCLFEHMLDDAINVHGAYVPVTEYLGNREFLCDISHFQQWGLTFGKPGDKIALISRLTVLPFHESTIEKVRVLNEHRFVLTVTDVPDQLPDVPLSVENLTWQPNLIFRNNIVRENRARSILVTTKGKVLIEDNYLSSQMHGILIEGDNNKWYESGAVQDVTIRNNEFVNIGYGKDIRYPLMAAPLLNKTQHMGEGRYHRNIKFVNNLIRSFNGHLVEAHSVDGLVITGNKMIFSSDYPKADEGEAIELKYCDQVVIEGNTAKNFQQPMRIAQSEDTEDVTIARNTGFKAMNAQNPKTAAK